MNRLEIAYLLIALMVAVSTAIGVFSCRFMAYQRDLLRGRRRERPVRKPFWMQ